jgi:hypothetical protein
MKFYWISIALLLSLLLGGCDSSKPLPSTPLPVLPTHGESTPMPPSQSTPAASNLQNLIDKATQDLAQRLSISATQINIVNATEVVWPDGSLGCPQKGMAYIQVLTPGYLIVLEVDNNNYEYHANKGTFVIYCRNPAPPILGTPDNT